MQAKLVVSNNNDLALDVKPKKLCIFYVFDDVVSKLFYIYCLLL